MIDIKLKLLKILQSEEKSIKKEEIKKIISSNKSEKDIKQLIQLFYALKIGGIQFTIDFDKENIKMIDGAISGYIDIYTDTDGYLDKFFLIPQTSKISNLDGFEAAIKKLNASYEIIWIHNDKKQLKKSNGLRNLAVASMVKIIIAGCVYDEVINGKIDFENEIEIRREHISVLSAGISEKDIGNSINIKNLLKNMLLISDNSAMDILIDFLGKEKINQYIRTNILEKYQKCLMDNIKLTKSVYGEAWCFDQNSMKQSRHRSLTEVAWTKGLDYFIPLSTIGDVMKTILKNEWVPWDDLSTNEELVYKGGSAPGVLSCIWTSRKYIRNHNLQLLFAINREHVFSLLEELYIFECANKLLQQFLNVEACDKKGV
ncbi:serine hydrolase [Staphylococcus caprae]|uniref:serine hydrolase n=1 Tax=Staphylococcus caprae TaxID=29380 RepID=UPI0024B5D57A|nr:serine hydrolase [Staphylococcus caprae]MDI9232133.1 serine hydrolase [Staphylococcus caprae]